MNLLIAISSILIKLNIIFIINKLIVNILKVGMILANAVMCNDLSEQIEQFNEDMNRLNKNFQEISFQTEKISGLESKLNDFELINRDIEMKILKNNDNLSFGLEDAFKKIKIWR